MFLNKYDLPKLYREESIKNFIDKNTVSITNGSGKTWSPLVKDWHEIPVSHSVQKSTQIGSKTLVSDL